MTELLIALAVAALAGLAVAAVIAIRRRSDQRREEREIEEAERQADEDIDRLLATGKATVQGVIETATRFRDEGFGEMVRSSLEQLTGWAQEDRSELRQLAGRSGTLSILFSDIEDSTAMNERVGDRAWVRILTAHDRVVRERVDRHGGHVVKSQGDGFMVAFPEPEPAVRCAVDIEEGIASGGRRLRKAKVRVRIGIHHGRAVAKDGDLFGRNVAYAARVADEAEGGEILVSGDLADAAGEIDGLEYGEPREVELKGLPGSHEVRAVEWD